MIKGLHWRVWSKKIKEWTLNSCCYVGERCFEFMTTSYGFVRLKNDGRFEWFIKPSSGYGHSSWKNTRFNQGVCKTLEEAKQKILSNFDIPLSPMEIAIDASNGFIGPSKLVYLMVKYEH